MSWKMTRIAFLVTLSAVVTATAQAKPVPDLTGTWRGTQVCDDFVDGKREGFVLTNDIVEISQTGDRIRMASFGLLYEGVVQGTGPKTGEAMAVTCGGSLQADEIVRIENVRTGPPEQAAWEAISIFFSEDPSLGTNFSDCKWAYERISKTDPNVPACP